MQALRTPLIPIVPLLFGLVSLIDAAVGSREPAMLLAALGQGIAAGGFVAAVAGLVFHLAYGRRWTVAAVIWVVLGAAFAAWPIHRLAAVERLRSVYLLLALLVIGASVAAGLVLVVAGLALQPRPTHPRGWLFGQARRWQVAVSLVSAAAALSFNGIDRLDLLVTYPVALVALRWLGLLFMTVAVAAAAPAGGPVLSRYFHRFWYIGLGVVLAGMVVSARVDVGVLTSRPYSGLALATLRWVMDVDRDGYSALFPMRDCNELDPRVNPGATERPRNGIDDNCMLGDASARPAPLDPNAVRIPASASPVSVVYISADTLNARHMGIYGYERNTTPNIDAWARAHGVVFEHAETTGATTVIAFSSIFRGVYARRLHWSRVAKTAGGTFVPFPEGAPPRLMAGDRVDRTYWLPPADPHPTLSWWLRRRGMKTFAVTAVHFAKPGSGVAGAFEELVSLEEHGSADPDDEGATRQALEWLSSLRGTDRYFLWIHYLGPHTPTTVHDGVADFGSGVVGGYDNEVATFDRRVRPLLVELTRRQHAGEPLVVILGADHGEEFGASRYHAHSLSESVTHVPLVIALPGAPARRVPDLVSTVDLVPTILGLCEAPIPPGLDGMDLSGLLRDERPLPARVVYSDAWVELSDTLVTNKIAASDGKFRVIRDLIAQSSVRERLGQSGETPAPTAAEVAHLEHALDQYLEETAVAPL